MPFKFFCSACKKRMSIICPDLTPELGFLKGLQYLVYSVPFHSTAFIKLIFIKSRTIQWSVFHVGIASWWLLLTLQPAWLHHKSSCLMVKFNLPLKEVRITSRVPVNSKCHMIIQSHFGWIHGTLLYEYVTELTTYLIKHRRSKELDVTTRIIAKTRFSCENGSQSNWDAWARMPRQTFRPEVKLILRELYSQRRFLLRSTWKVRTHCSLQCTLPFCDCLQEQKSGNVYFISQ
jgi:hypothetical protein